MYGAFKERARESRLKAPLVSSIVSCVSRVNSRTVGGTGISRISDSMTVQAHPFSIVGRGLCFAPLFGTMWAGYLYLRTGEPPLRLSRGRTTNSCTVCCMQLASCSRVQTSSRSVVSDPANVLLCSVQAEIVPACPLQPLYGSPESRDVRSHWIMDICLCKFSVENLWVSLRFDAGWSRGASKFKLTQKSTNKSWTAADMFFDVPVDPCGARV